MRVGLIHDVLSACYPISRNIKEICDELGIHRNTLHSYLPSLMAINLLDEVEDPPKGRGGTRARWFLTTGLGREFTARYRLAVFLLGPFNPIEEISYLVETSEVTTEVTCSMCGSPIAFLSSVPHCGSCGYEFPQIPVMAEAVLFANELARLGIVANEVSDKLSILSSDLADVKKHEAELQADVDRLFEASEKTGATIDDVRGLIKSLQPLVKQASEPSG